MNNDNDNVHLQNLVEELLNLWDGEKWRESPKEILDSMDSYLFNLNFPIDALEDYQELILEGNEEDLIRFTLYEDRDDEIELG